MIDIVTLYDSLIPILLNYELNRNLKTMKLFFFFFGQGKKKKIESTTRIIIIFCQVRVFASKKKAKIESGQNGSKKNLIIPLFSFISSRLHAHRHNHTTEKAFCIHKLFCPCMGLINTF